MKTYKRSFALALIIVLCMSLVTGCGSSGSGEGTTNAEPRVIRISGTVNDTHPVSMTEYKFEELFEAATDGRYDVQVYTNGSMGSFAESFEAVQLGNLEICDSGNMVVAPYTKALSFMDIPFLFPNKEVALAFADGDVCQKAYDRMAEETGVRPLCPMDLGYMTLSNNVREVRTPEDLAGIKFRVQETDMYLKYFNTMGGSPMPMALAEVFTAAQQGTVDGITTQNAVFYSQSFYEVIKYISDMNPYYCFAYMYTSEDFLNSLPEEDYEIFMQCMDEARDYGREVATDYITKIDQELEELCVMTHLTDEEKVAFKESAEFMIDYFKETIGDPNLEEYIAEIDRLTAALS